MALPGPSSKNPSSVESVCNPRYHADMTSAKIVLDSVAPNGSRLTTMEVTFHRFVLAEFNTHRVFSRNSASSRAIPVEKQLQKVKENPAFPLEWPCEKPGMQGGDFLEGSNLHAAEHTWKEAHRQAVSQVERYLEAYPEKDERLHKSLLNRLLEPFMWHTVIVSSTEWEGFWHQRCSPLAQPEIRAVAELMREAYNNSTPSYVGYGGWHTPYISDEEYEQFDLETRKRVSTARCARVSYLTHDGTRDYLEDLKLFERLATASPPHASPLEHVATPFRPSASFATSRGNFRLWDQYRHQMGMV